MKLKTTASGQARFAGFAAALHKPKSHGVHLGKLWALLLILPLVASVARAQSGSENYGLVSALIGQGSANGSQSLKNNSCAPTAVDNGLSYLEAYQLSISNPDPFGTTPNVVGQLNNLQSNMGTTVNGTSLTNLWSGLNTYLTMTNPGSTVQKFGQQDNNTSNGGLLPTGWGAQAGATTAIPSVSYLANWLNQNAGVEISILWGTYSGGTFTPSGGGHEVTLDQISGSSIGFVDPWGQSQTTNAAGNAEQINGTLQAVTVNSNSYLYLTYPAAGTSGDLPGDTTSGNGTSTVGSQVAQNGPTGIIIADTIEQVPEPGSGLITLLGGAGLLLRRRR